MNLSIHISILSLVLSWYLTDANLQFRVLNGKDIRIEDSRHSIAIFYDNEYKAVGSLIKNNLVVTAMHCIRDRVANKFLLLAGVAELSQRDSVQAQKHGVLSTHRHPEYRREDGYADIAVLKVDGYFLNTNQVKPIPLCGLGKLEEKTPLRISGWGSLRKGFRNSYDHLQSVELYVLKLEVCRLKYKDTPPGYLADTLICAGTPGSNPSYGDGGAGAIADNKLCAVVQSGCDSELIPSLYTDITNPIVKKFLTDMIKNN